MVLVSFLAGGIGLLAGLIAYLLYNLIGLFTNIVFYHRFVFAFVSAREQSSWAVGHRDAGHWRNHCRHSWRKLWLPQDKGPWNSRSDGSGADQSQPHSTTGSRFLKPVSAAIAIGTGGPFGAEGPIIQTGGAIGSLIGQLVHTTASERKVLLACGAAAGMSATFNTPIAGVILAIELLLFEFKSRSFIPLVIASTIATAVHMQLLGAGPMFTVSAMDFGIPRALPFYVLLGVSLWSGRGWFQQTALLDGRIN